MREQGRTAGSQGDTGVPGLAWACALQARLLWLWLQRLVADTPCHSVSSCPWGGGGAPTSLTFRNGSSRVGWHWAGGHPTMAPLTDLGAPGPRRPMHEPLSSLQPRRRQRSAQKTHSGRCKVRAKATQQGYRGGQARTQRCLNMRPLEQGSPASWSPQAWGLAQPGLGTPRMGQGLGLPPGLQEDSGWRG